MAEIPTVQFRDRVAPRLAELARLLEDPTPKNIALVQRELERLVKMSNKERKAE